MSFAHCFRFRTDARRIGIKVFRRRENSRALQTIFCQNLTADICHNAASSDLRRKTITLNERVFCGKHRQHIAYMVVATKRTNSQTRIETNAFSHVCIIAMSGTLFAYDTDEKRSREARHRQTAGGLPYFTATHLPVKHRASLFPKPSARRTQRRCSL